MFDYFYIGLAMLALFLFHEISGPLFWPLFGLLGACIMVGNSIYDCYKLDKELDATAKRLEKKYGIRF
jgi:hypothetical protein